MKKNRKFLITFIAVFMLCICFVFGASALQESGQYGDNAYWSYNSETGELVISGTGKLARNNNETASPFIIQTLKVL